MLGGGTFTAQNKVLPGTYINYVSAAIGSAAIGVRGIIAMPIELDWGESGVIEVTSSSFATYCKKQLGYPIDSEKLANIREVMANATTLYIYRLNGSGEKATCNYGTAKYAGTRGNDLTIGISANVDDTSKFNVTTYLDGVEVEKQTVAAATELEDNDYVTFKTDATLEATAGTPLAGGTNSTVDGTAYTEALAAFESYSFNTLACLSDEDTIKAVVVSYVKRMRDEVGSKFQAVIHDVAADYEGVINVDDINAIPWVAGAVGACAINKSCTNMKYNGELEITSNYTQAELEKALKAGKFVFTTVGSEVHVLRDINSLTTLTTEKGRDFSNNQVIRVLDDDANTTAEIFNKTFLGKVNNNEDGRIAFKSALVTAALEMQNIGAISDFTKDDITVEEGNLSESVVVTKYIKPSQAMEILYCTVYVN
jgi:hypothetical protein